ncbi:ATP-dependent DNA helicase Rep [Methyloglobulus morosus KoM1]|uniref:ATP-dependent DNA helicase Rep n=1 Tax=Methyloglobulus morosus KoM1 TaxID=1116472 RepID=V5C2I3_9GAMM|nr:DNA helicase Rep [Methyloglobulus morosus]ESS72662.1 ATP-dependent DNA helicase Rep [Methyloglobulus morosus KoM1]
MTQLNPQQLAAVKLVDCPLLVLAGAGSGKTRVITEKIAYLIKQGLPARHITAVTFTNKAAREMQSRVAKLLDKQQARGLRVSTFHALGLEIIRKEHKTLGYKPGLSLYDEEDKVKLLKNLIVHSKSDCDAEQVEQYANQIGQWKNAFVTAKQAGSTSIAEQKATAQLYADYIRSLKAYNAVDFDDLILLPVLLFQQHPAVLEKWQNTIRYLLVDEYQDTNLTQYELVKLLAGNLGRFTVVGDDDQSIYAWRGAQPENLSQLQKDFPRLQVIKLEQNYRSTGRILKVANQLIANNPHTYEKKLWSELGYGDPLRVLSHKDEITEAQQMVAELIHHKFKSGGRYRDYAILYRGNHQSRLFERGLRENNIPYFISGSTSFFAYSEIKDILAYLRLLVNPDDNTAFLRIINTPRRELGPSTLEKLSAYANQRQISLLSACNEMGLGQIVSSKSQIRLQKFYDWIMNAAQQVEQHEPFKIIAAMIVEIGYENWLRENAKTIESAERKMKNVHELIDWLKRIANKDPAQEKALDEVIANIMLMDILERNQEEESGDQVSLMTLHSAKGLEFQHVLLVGMEENILPHQNTLESDEQNGSNGIEEERRLAYVGITRAQRTLTFSYCTHRKKYGDIMECQPSRFLGELPEDDLEWVNKKQLPADVVKERGKTNLQNLRAMLS